MFLTSNVIDSEISLFLNELNNTILNIKNIEIDKHLIKDKKIKIGFRYKHKTTNKTHFAIICFDLNFDSVIIKIFEGDKPFSNYKIPFYKKYYVKDQKQLLIIFKKFCKVYIRGNKNILEVK